MNQAESVFVAIFYTMVVWIGLSFIGAVWALLHDLWRQHRKSREYWRGL